VIIFQGFELAIDDCVNESVCEKNLVKVVQVAL
jgi:hypothetical protein